MNDKAGQPGQGQSGQYPGQHPGYWQGGPQAGPPSYGPSPWQQQYPGYPQYPLQPGFPSYGGQAPKKRGRKLLGAGALGLAMALVAGSVAWGIDRQVNGSQLAQKQLDPAAVAAKVSPALVDVNTVLGYVGARAAGTGIVLTADGEVLTNHHVVEGATSITVTDIGNGKTYQASVAGYDEHRDVAVLKLKDASGLQTATIGDSSKVAIGDQVVGIGNAGGAGGEPSYAAGTVTGLNQSITATDENGTNPENLTGMIETNANIQAGDSGGPLVDAAGEVIGIDTAGSSGNSGGNGSPGQQTSATTGTATALTAAAVGTAYGNGNGNGGPTFGPGSGFGGSGNGSGNGGGGNGQGQAPKQGFAIPIDQAMDLAGQIQNGDASDTVHIGASAMLGVSVLSNAGTTGAVVGDVIANGKADKAGIEPGDVITSFAGKTVESPDALSALLNRQHPGDKVEVGWLDQLGRQHKATIELVTGPVR